MNKELIEQLLKKASGLESATLSMEKFTFYKDDIDKLVELVVKECIQAIEKPEGTWVDPVEANECVTLIKMRFGVE